MKNLHIQQRRAFTVDEYKALPKSEREWFGLYKKPRLYTFNDLFSEDTLDVYWKATYPVQYFFRETVPDTINGMKHSISNKCTAVRRLLRPNHPRFRKAYPRRTYMDLDGSIPAVIFALFRDFWHEEVYPDTFVDWDHDDIHQELYTWMQRTIKVIEEELPALEKQMDHELTKATNASARRGKTYDEIYGVYNELEKQYKELETKTLIEIIERRESLWT